MLTVSAIRGFCLGQAWYGIMGTLPARAVVGEFILESLDGLERSRVAP